MKKLVELIFYIGQRPLPSGRVGLAVILRKCDFGAYAHLGEPITEARYLAAETPGEVDVPRGVLRAAIAGWRWGRVEHRLLAGRLERADAEWIAAQWRDGIPT